MKEINIARTIASKRKEKGITQSDLANFIGVSKASVSKWEIGQSYPDITFLPQLAAYFDISIDDLMGYEPQMTNEDIRKLYKELSVEFTTKPFDEVVSRCRNITKKYFSCFPLLYQIGVLFVNYGYTVAKDEKQSASTISEAKELSIRVKNQCDDVELKQLALHLEATCEIMLGNPNEVIGLLKNAKTSTVSYEVLLAQAYQMTGKIQEAKTKLQGSIYDSIGGLFGTITPYLAICADDAEHFEEICKRTIELIKIFKVKELHPVGILPFYLTAAQGYLANQNSEKTLDMLETYTDIVTGDIYPLTLKGDDFFNLIDGLLEEELPFGTADLPRDEKSIKQSMSDAVINNPAFSIFAENPRYQNIATRLKNNINMYTAK